MNLVSYSVRMIQTLTVSLVCAGVSLVPRLPDFTQSKKVGKPGNEAML